MSGRDVEVLSAVRAGRLVRSERLESGGVIQSWVLAGQRGAAEMRGTSRDRLYCLTHAPARQGDVTYGHILLILVDAVVWPGSGCTVLEAQCCARLATSVPDACLRDLTDPWEGLEALYREHLGEP